eukprot:CAMPEP_0113914252 /NCGR_PEP_ID=MMETSP0780_2-20120614/30238_1 /TAXON_ID=652834 /ORGANISM="Palpitomonas bilix" /LENGTH=153 /DNA_ID=CAMNT_0000912019 /DNA_START=50 /DNA_END=508 /DNA_ORIENTATION=- /assembly_acc=CAM_ASM_000599
MTDLKTLSLSTSTARSEIVNFVKQARWLKSFNLFYQGYHTSMPNMQFKARFLECAKALIEDPDVRSRALKLRLYMFDNIGDDIRQQTAFLMGQQYAREERRGMQEQQSCRIFVYDLTNTCDLNRVWTLHVYAAYILTKRLPLELVEKIYDTAW